MTNAFNTTEFDQAFEEIGIVGDTKKLYAEFLSHIDTPADLKCLSQVLKNFLETFEHGWLDELSLNAVATTKTNRWLSLANDLLERIQKQHIPARKVTSEKVKKNLYGTLTKNPLYQIYYISNINNPYFYKWLRQVIFIMPFAVNMHDFDFKEYEFRNLGIFFREFTEQEESVLWLQQQNCVSCEDISIFIDWIYSYRSFFREYHKLSISELERTGQKSSSNPRAHAIARYREISKNIEVLEILIGYQKNRRATYGRRGGHRAIREVAALHGVTALESDILVQIETFSESADSMLFSLLQPKLDQKMIDAGEEIYEQQSDIAYIFADSEPLEAYISAFHGRKLSKSIIRRIERQHQYLVSQNPLSNEDIYKILNWCRKPKSMQFENELAFYVVGIFFYSLPFEKIYRCVTNIYEGNSVNIDLKTRSFAFEVFKVQYASDDDTQSNLNYLHLPIPISFEEPLLFYYEILDKYHSSDDEYDCYMNPVSSQKLVIYNKIEFETALKEVFGIEITEYQLSTYMFHRACSMYGPTCATLLFNRAAPGSQARLYYTALPASLLQNRFKQLVERVLQDTNLKDHVAFGNELPHPEFQIGCRDLATEDDYQQLLTALINRLNELRSQSLTNQWVLFHNLFTAYCVVAQGLLTGVRPTHQGFITTKQIIYAAKVAVVRDKDTEDEYHTRTIPLHPVAIKIAESYQSHMDSMLGRLHRIGLLKRWQGSGGPEPFFFTNTDSLDDSYNLSLISFKPTMQLNTLKPFFSKPANSNRKFLRSFFERKGVSPYCIDALLGHGNLGEKIWHQHGTLSLEDVRKTLNPYFDQIVHDLGIVVVQGLKS